jgi:hypothetical protein
MSAKKVFTDSGIEIKEVYDGQGSNVPATAGGSRRSSLYPRRTAGHVPWQTLDDAAIRLASAPPRKATSGIITC